MKTAILLFTIFLMFTQCYKTNKPTPVPAAFSLKSIDNYVGWSDYSILPEKTLHLKCAPINFYNTGALRISLVTGPHFPDFYYGIFIDKQCNPCIPGLDTFNINTDSEIKILETETTHFNNPPYLPEC